MAVGCGGAAVGDGGRDRCGAWDSIVLSGRQHMFRSLDLAGVGDSALAGADGEASAGCRLGLGTGSTRGGVDTAAASEWSASDDLVRLIASAESRRSMRAHDFPTLLTLTMSTSVMACRLSVRGSSVQDTLLQPRLLTGS
jgi:hypothetical protein